MTPRRLNLLAAFAIALVWACLLGCAGELQEHPRRIAAWEGYYHAGLNYRFHLAQAKTDPRAEPFAREWKQVEARWCDLWKNTSNWSEPYVGGRLAELKSRSDDIEVREPPDMYDPELMGKVHDELNAVLGVKDE